MAESRGLVPAVDEEQPKQSRAGRRFFVCSLGASVTLLGVALSVVLLHRHLQLGEAAKRPLLQELQEVVELEEEEENACDKYPYLKYEVPNAVVYNNLANKGPNHGNGEGLVYQTVDLGHGAGDELDREVYLVINATSTDYKPFSPRMNGVQGKYGSINLNSGSSVDLLFTFFDRETMKKLTLPEFAITFFDLDTGTAGTSAEYVIIGGFKSHHVTGKTEVRITKEDDGRTKFLATQVGTGEDNPVDPNFLTAQQKNRAVTLLYGATESLHVTIGATPGSGPRFFTFVGRPSLLCAITVQDNFRPPLKDLTFQPPMQDAVYVHSREELVTLDVTKGDKVKKGDPIAATQSKGGPPKLYVAEHDGIVSQVQDKLKPGDQLDERLSEKIIAVIDRPSLEALAKSERVVGGGPGTDSDLPSETVFVAFIKEVGDRVNTGDAIATVKRKEDSEAEEVKATACGIVQERQEGLEPDMLLLAVPDANLLTLKPFPALATDEETQPAAEVKEEEAGLAFERYIVKKGDIVKAGDTIAFLKDEDGNDQPIKASSGGIVADLQDIKAGTTLDRLEDGNLATVGKFPLLPVGPGMAPVSLDGSAGTPAPQEGASDRESGTEPEPTKSDAESETTPAPLGAVPVMEQDQVDKDGLKFVRYEVQPGGIVETGDAIAVVEDKDGKQHKVLTPRPGVVKHIQEGLKEGMVLEKVLKDDTLAVVDKLPVLEVSANEQAVFAPLDENWKLKEWKVEQGDDVLQGDTIAVLTNPATGEKREVVANKTGVIKELMPHLNPGDVVKETTKDNDLAIIGRPREADLGFREMGVRVPDMSCHFVGWNVATGDRVHTGDGIADVECGKRRLSNGRMLMDHQWINIPSPGTGTVTYEAELTPGKPISAGAATPTIAKVDLGPPWWLALLAMLCSVCCCYVCLYHTMQKPMPYKPMLPPPDPQPEQEEVPDGLRLDFEDNGTIRTVYAKYRPLGIKHNNTAPVVADDFTCNSYSKQELGVNYGWKLTRIGDEELYDTTDFACVNEKLTTYMKDFPIWPLPLEFRKSMDEGDTHIYHFTERPLGLEFTNQAPIKVDKVYDGGPAQDQQVEIGWYLTRIGDFDVQEHRDFREVLHIFKEGVLGLRDTGMTFGVETK